MPDIYILPCLFHFMQIINKLKERVLFIIGD